MMKITTEKVTTSCISIFCKKSEDLNDWLMDNFATNFHGIIQVPTSIKVDAINALASYDIMHRVQLEQNGISFIECATIFNSHLKV